jgi:hypothetical protein
MKYLFSALTIITFLLAGCSGGSKTTSIIDNGTVAYNNGDFAAALESFEKVIASYAKEGNEAECPVYDDAGLAAWKSGNKEKGLEYLEIAQSYGTAGPEAYATLAGHYREIDNLSKEIDALAVLDEKYFDSEPARQYRKRLFEVYIESENWEPALITWSNLGAEKETDPELLESYLLLNKELGNKDVVDGTAEKLLALDPENIMALEWLGEKYYWLAENSYKAEMEAYEKNRTNKQYNQLLKAFETVSANFKTSLTYFKKLYKLDPSGEYATFLSNIYARLDDKEKAEYYKGLIK